MEVTESLDHIWVFLSLENLLVAFKDPFVGTLSLLKVHYAVEVGERVPFVRLLVFTWNHFLVVLWVLQVIDEAIVDSLIGIFVVKSKPSSLKSFLIDFLATSVQHVHS
jgi:hypothetical protein